MSNPSRFDIVSLLSSGASEVFNRYSLNPEFNQLGCDIRLLGEPAPLLSDTKCILLLGEAALHKYLPTTINNTLGEMRGSYFEKGAFGLPTIASFLPQDAADFKNYEAEHNVLAGDFTGDDSTSDDDEDEGNLKGMSTTKRANYAFWIKTDVAKCKAILLGKIPERIKPKYYIAPDSKLINEVLLSTKNGTLLYDKETNYENQDLLCFSFSFDGYNIYSVPIIDYSYNLYYSNTGRILQSLREAIHDNTIVSHNGANFDFLVFAMKYRIAIKRAYDTMLAQHRCYPAVEKSLGHCTSLWTWEKFHKDSDSEKYRTHSDMIQKLEYCGKDVFTMGLIKKGIDAFAKTIPGLESSIKCANDSIRPYLTGMMQGIDYDPEKVSLRIRENDALMEQYMRIINILIGNIGMEEIKKNAVKSKKSGAFPGSNAQCVEYFHNILGYPAAKNPEGGITLGKKSLFKLALKHDNPVIKFVLLYRQTKKETSALKFNPFRGDDGKILPRIKNEES